MNEKEIKSYLLEKSKYMKPLEVKEIGRGGEAVVFRVEHTNL
jgi:hypothetical protein